MLCLVGNFGRFEFFWREIKVKWIWGRGDLGGFGNIGVMYKMYKIRKREREREKEFSGGGEREEWSIKLKVI